MLPHVERSSVRLVNFNLRRISHTKGSVAREYGNIWEGLVRRAVKKKGDRLAVKVNSKVEKKPERFEIPAGILAVFGQDTPKPDVVDQAAKAK